MAAESFLEENSKLLSIAGKGRQPLLNIMKKMPQSSKKLTCEKMRIAIKEFIAANPHVDLTPDADAPNKALDKFYTVPATAAKCLAKVGELYDWGEWGLVVEPSAGNGSFFLRIPTEKKVGIDILPEHADITQKDFFTYAPPPVSGKILVVGNPPFGRVSSAAIKFFNHAAKWADVIAFIIPRTFRRISVSNKLDMRFHMVADEEIPLVPCSFEPPMMAKCCFQIWEKKPIPRSAVDNPTTHPDWDFLGFGADDEKGQPTPPDGADFALRAYGGKCGQITEAMATLRPKSWHWIRAKINKNILMERFASLDYSLSTNTARQNSIGRGELVYLYTNRP